MKTQCCIPKLIVSLVATWCVVTATILTGSRAQGQGKDGAIATGGDKEKALGGVRFVESSDATGTSMAVVVGRVPLAHTAQVLPVDAGGRVVGAGNGALQVEKALDNLSLALGEAKTGLDRLVKVNVYIAKAGMVREVERVFSRRFSGKIKPAICLVETKLSNSEALIAMDGIATTTMDAGTTSQMRRASTKLPGSQSVSHVAVLPEGTKVYVSGQAEPGEIKEATRKTMDGLMRTLNHVGLNRSQIVQIKAFIQPIEAAPEVEREIGKQFTDQLVPPLVFVEWVSKAPIEIELVASGGDPRNPGTEPVDYVTPPGTKASPVYSRVARINFGNTVYFSGLYGSSAQTAEAQVKEVFASLGFLLDQTGSNMRQLVKATYYVSDDEAGRKLNELRPAYYDPKRPPAASKAMVTGVASEGKTITLDMIAVSVR